MGIWALPGCVVYTSPHHKAANSAPSITYADAGCYWDAASGNNPDGYNDYVWWFEADVYDDDSGDDGGDDVMMVYADVYDEYTGEWVDGFDLLPDGGVTWFSAWVGSSTYLDCSWPGYVVDITAIDYADDMDIVSVYPTQLP
ncbi:MAG: hypothetical protein EXR69_16120 [Myxococcales bacterium]|nr:hypothetical protein [Myxococcales bacterium]